jgi:hypothetical protein
MDMVSLFLLGVQDHVLLLRQQLILHRKLTGKLAYGRGRFGDDDRDVASYRAHSKGRRGFVFLGFPSAFWILDAAA